MPTRTRPSAERASTCSVNCFVDLILLISMILSVRYLRCLARHETYSLFTITYSLFSSRPPCIYCFREEMIFVQTFFRNLSNTRSGRSLIHSISGLSTERARGIPLVEWEWWSNGMFGKLFAL